MFILTGFVLWRLREENPRFSYAFMTKIWEASCNPPILPSSLQGAPTTPCCPGSPLKFSLLDIHGGDILFLISYFLLFFFCFFLPGASIYISIFILELKTYILRHIFIHTAKIILKASGHKCPKVLTIIYVVTEAKAAFETKEHTRKNIIIDKCHNEKKRKC